MPSPTAPGETALLTIPEAARELRVGDNTVYRLIASGALVSTDIAPEGSKKSKTRIARDDLLAYIRSRKSTAKPARAAGRRRTATATP